MLSGFFVVLLVEASDQFLENGTHSVVVEGGQLLVTIRVVDWSGTQVDGWVEKLLNQEAENVRLNKCGDLVAEFELIEASKSALSCCCFARAFKSRSVKGEVL